MEAEEATRPPSSRDAARDLLAGVILLGVGLALGGSGLRGEADAIDRVFDLLALYWIVSGAIGLWRASNKAAG